MVPPGQILVCRVRDREVIIGLIKGTRGQFDVQMHLDNQLLFQGTISHTGRGLPWIYGRRAREREKNFSNFKVERGERKKRREKGAKLTQREQICHEDGTSVHSSRRFTPFCLSCSPLSQRALKTTLAGNGTNNHLKNVRLSQLLQLLWVLMRMAAIYFSTPRCTRGAVYLILG